MMKKLFAAVIGGTMIAAIAGGALALAHSPADLENVDLTNCYPKTAVVMALAPADDLVVLKDPNGQCWTFEGVEDYMIGDVVSLIMHDNGTEIIYDDAILRVQYSGYQENLIH